LLRVEYTKEVNSRLNKLEVAAGLKAQVKEEEKKEGNKKVSKIVKKAKKVKKTKNIKKRRKSN